MNKISTSAAEAIGKMEGQRRVIGLDLCIRASVESRKVLQNGGSLFALGDSSDSA
jgi:hypothetical protein